MKSSAAKPVWIFCCWCGCLLAAGCSSQPASDVAQPAAETEEGAIPSASGSLASAKSATLEEADAAASVPAGKVPGDMPATKPSDDRYSQQTPANIEVQPWEGPRPKLPVEALKVEQFDAAWQIDLDVSDQPLAKVIEEIVAEVPGWQPQVVLANASNDVEATADMASLIDKPISLKLSKVSRLEAIERACKAAGVFPEFTHGREFAAEAKPIIRLHAGQRGGQAGEVNGAPSANWVAFAGPQLIEVASVREFPPYAVGGLELRMLALPLPEPVINLMTEPVCHFDRVLVAGDQNVLAAVGGTTQVITPTILDVRNENLLLRGLTRNVERLASVAGHVSLPIPLQTSVVWLDSLAEGYTARTDELTATIRMNWITPGSWAMRYEVISGSGIEGLAAFAYDADGKLIPTLSFGTTWAPGFNQGSGSLNVATEPRMLAVVVVDKLAYFTREFALENIPLAKSAEQPVVLAQLSFGNFDQPVSASVGPLKEEGIFRQVEVALSNHANKDIREIQATLHYFDAQGEKKQDTPVLMAANYQDAKVPYPILVAAGSIAKLQQTAPLCPPEIKQVTLTVNSVLYADLDRWPVDNAP